MSANSTLSINLGQHLADQDSAERWEHPTMLKSAGREVVAFDHRFALLDPPYYSSDLAPSDFFLFLYLKIELRGQRFSSNKEAITFVNNYFAKKNDEYYLNKFQR